METGAGAKEAGEEEVALMNSVIERLGAVSDSRMIAVYSISPAKLTRAAVAIAFTNKNNCRCDSVPCQALSCFDLLVSRRLESYAF